MKKIFILLITLLLSLSLIACDSENEDSQGDDIPKSNTTEPISNTTEPKSNIIELSSIYIELGEIYKEIDILVNDIYSAWTYGLYDKNYSIYKLSMQVSLTSSELKGAKCSLLFLNSIQICVECVIDSHKELGHYDEIRDSLDEIKVRIQNLDIEDEKELDLIELLDEYYNALVSYFDIAEDYKSSYTSFQKDILDYRNKIKDILDNLVIDLG